MRRRLPQAGLMVAILLALSVLRIADPAPVAQLRLMVFDGYQRLNPRRPDTDGPVRIIDIDDESIRRIGQWPWPRTVIAKLVDKAAAHGAAAIGLDIVLSEPDRLSPEQVIGSWSGDLSDLRLRVAGLPSNDEVLARAIARAPAVLGLVLTDKPNSKPPVLKAGFAHAGDDPRRFVPGFEGALAALPALNAAAKGQGAINWRPDGDQIIRRLPLFLSAAGKLYPALAMEVLRVAQGASTYIIKSSGASGERAFGASTGVTAVKVGALEIPTAGNGEMWLRYAPMRRELYIPAWRLLEGEVDQEVLRGRIVLVGTSAAGLLDLRATPLSPAVPGIEVHAQAIEQIVAGAFLRRPDYADAMELVVMVAGSLILGALVVWFGALWSGVAAVLAIGAVGASSWFAFERAGWLLDPVYPVIAIVVLYLAGTVFGYLRTERERRQVRQAFSRYLAPSVVEEIAGDPDRLTLGGEDREMTLMFCDIRGFTKLAEGLSANELVTLLNRYLTPMTEVILAHRWTIDKYMGDCIMAFWNAPLDDGDHARNACRAALDMVEKLKILNQTLKEEAKQNRRRFHPIRIGIGLNTGLCCVGNMGSDQRFDYSVIGDNVNVASRLEGQTKTYGVTIIAGARTISAVPELAAVELDLIKVKGRQEAERIFALLCDHPSAYDPAYRDLHEAHVQLIVAYRSRKWTAAMRHLKVCSRRGGPELKVYYEMLAARIRHFRKDPPQQNWDGIYRAETK